MESVLTPEPGVYSLRLLLADSKHLPWFVYSKPIKITVSEKNQAVAPKVWSPMALPLKTCLPTASWARFSGFSSMLSG